MAANTPPPSFIFDIFLSGRLYGVLLLSIFLLYPLFPATLIFLQHGVTALMVATSNDHEDCITVLLAANGKNTVVATIVSGMALMVVFFISKRRGWVSWGNKSSKTRRNRVPKKVVRKKSD